MRPPFHPSMLAGLLPLIGVWLSPAPSLAASPQLQASEVLESLDKPPSMANKANPGPGWPITLQSSHGLQETPSVAERENQPTYVGSDSISGHPDVDTVLQGHVQLRRGDTLIRADKLEYRQAQDQAKATGHVYLNRAGNRYEGELLDLHVDAMAGFILQPRYQFLQTQGHGQAERMDFVDDKHATAKKATYTTCTRKPGPSWVPDWFMQAEQISFDMDRNEGVATDALLTFKNLPVLPIPSFSFPLTDERKSGFLPPTFGLDSLGGVEMSVPYYVNLAPNRDLTVTATPMTRRGVKLSNEFRYMERNIPQPPFVGTARLELMPIDELRSHSRWGYSHQHTGWGDLTQPIAFSFNLNRVSDANYWRDFSSSTGDPLSQRILSNSATLGWASGTFTSSVSVQKWQTLQDSDASTAIAAPFDRLPQLNANYLRSNLPGGFDWSVGGELTRFSVDRSFFCDANGGNAYCNQPNANRVVLQTQISRPMLVPYGYVTPKLMLQARQYQFDSTYRGIARNSLPTDSANVSVPTFSLDTGAVFERQAKVFGLNWTQTLEPRAFYVYTPFRTQNDLPNYDTGFNDFNFATVFTENAFSGNDRISDTHTFTMGATSRLINTDTGAEGARFGLAQRLRLSDQQVLLTPTDVPLTSTYSDILAGASVNITPRFSVDSIVQYNPEFGRSERESLGARYNPGSYRVISASYRHQRASSETADMSWQWPINDLWGDKGVDKQQGRGLGEQRWYSLGRFNYNLQEKRLVDTLLGLEYDAGCWVARFAMTRSQVSLTSATTRLMFQLELNDFSKLGVGNISSVRDNISRYQNLREPFKLAPSRFGQYD